MATGIDTSVSCLNAVEALKNAGVDFVARYYANKGKKTLSKPEALAIGTAGMRIVAIWEDGFPTRASYFSYAKCVDDGTSAHHDALLVGQPVESAIYFAVDYDAAPAEIAGSIGDYFRGVRDGFLTITAGGTSHSVGVYGSGATCSWLLARKLVTYTWLAQSSGFLGSAEFSTWNIKQGPTTMKCGIEVDTNEAVDDYGGFAVSF
jgi:hypothetical protein